MELCGMPSLPFAVGVYLPLSSSSPIFVGGVVRYIVDKYRVKSANEPAGEEASDMSPGVLFSTGYIAGGAIAGVIIAFFTFSDRLTQYLGNLIHVPQYDSIALAVFAALAVILMYFGLRKSDNTSI